MNKEKSNITSKSKSNIKDIAFGFFVLLIPVILIYLLFF